MLLPLPLWMNNSHECDSATMKKKVKNGDCVVFKHGVAVHTNAHKHIKQHMYVW